jgi:hypothetical protein
MIEPLPNCFSIWAKATCNALAFSLLAARGLTGASMKISLRINGLGKFQKLFLITGWILKQ